MILFGIIYSFFCSFKRGPFSVVRRCTNKTGDKQYAVKIIDVEQFTSTPGFSADGKIYYLLILINDN
jgi:hypothetical protein